MLYYFILSVMLTLLSVSSQAQGPEFKDRDHPLTDTNAVLQLFLTSGQADTFRQEVKGCTNLNIPLSCFQRLRRDQLEKLEDSLNKQGVNFHYINMDIQVYNVSPVVPLSGKVRTAKPPIRFFKQAHTAINYGLGSEPETDVELSYYSLTLENGELKFLLIEIPPAVPLFSEATIGGSVFHDFDQADDFIGSIHTYDTADLAAKLTRPFRDEFDKVRSIYMWVTKFITYDYIGLESKNTIVVYSDVLKYRRGVCQGYSSLFTYLCNRAGIASKMVFGKTQSGEWHAWNIVRINGQWYCVDATWGEFLLPPDQFVREHIPIIWAYSLLRSKRSTWFKELDRQ